MDAWHNIGIQRRLLISFLVVGMLPFLIMAATSITRSRGGLEAAAEGRLAAIQATAVRHLKQELRARTQLHDDARRTTRISAALGLLGEAYAEGGDGPEYRQVYKLVAPEMKRFAETFDLADVLLMDAAGRVVFSANEPALLGHDIAAEDAHRDLTLAHKKGSKASHVGDLYLGRRETVSMLISGPVGGSDEPERNGVLVFRIGGDAISEMVTLPNMNEELRVYAVGMDGRMRTNLGEVASHSVLASFRNPVSQSGITSPLLARAVAGEAGVETGKDPLGEEALTAFGPVKVGNTTWVVFADYSARAAFAAVRSLVTWSGAIGLLLLGLIIGGSIFVARQIGGDLRNVESALRSGTLVIAARSDQVRNHSAGLAPGATQQAASLETASVSLEELASSTTQCRDLAQTVARMAMDAEKEASRGRDTTLEMARHMEQIQQSSQETAAINQLIEELAFQTNLLALNAAVEAARAGDAGRGFAVVADEVRALAARSAEAAQKTSRTIDSSTQAVRAGVAAVGSLTSVLDELHATAASLRGKVESVASATSEQAMGITSVRDAVQVIEQTTSENAAAAQAGAQSADSLAGASGQLKQIGQHVATMIHGQKGHAIAQLSLGAGRR